MKLIDLTNKRFERLLVIEKRATNKNGQPTWFCRCDCGNTTTVLGANLRYGITKSCGCLLKDFMSGVGKANLLPNNEANVNRLLDYYRRNAKKRDLEWSIDRSRFCLLVQQSCHYCGGIPSSILHKENRPGELIYNGIDRLDSNLGYTDNNTVTCCWNCNRMKSAMPVDDFMRHIISIYNHFVALKASGSGGN